MMPPLEAAPTVAQSKLDLPAGLLVEGVVTFQGEVRLAGKVDGAIVCKMLTIEKSGELAGLGIADEITVRGTAEGGLYSSRLTLMSGSTVSGEIHHTHLVIEDNAFFEGKSRRVTNPRELGEKELSAEAAA